ncbi:MAG: NfeD family protein [Spirochaetaceae bacterium]|jgi:membrane protein implicated in regulation of membrane protease activity|nr:NfeD family protein [Spirochaetaceae bacterium]
MEILPLVQPHWIWLCAAILLALVELATSASLTTIWFAFPALILIFLSAIIVSFKLQLAIFLVLSLAMLILLRPLAIKKLKIGGEKTNAESLAGKTALVTRRIAEFETGEIKISGQFWSAKAELPTDVLEAGTPCQITRIEGVHAVVRPASSAQQTESTGSPNESASSTNAEEARSL